MPAISVIIPLYNAENFIGELLDSLLAQTFTDFEVVVVDDCSTSRAVVESYLEKFGGRLILSKTKKSSGSPAEPSNIGIALSRGEYSFFMDNDDAITPTALEELYPLAKNFDADVVACEKFYSVPEKFWYDAEYRRQLKPHSYKQGEFVTSPTLLTDDLNERANDYAQQKFLWPVWTKFIRRKFLAENQIRFEPVIASDLIFTTCLIFAAKRWLRVPNAIYYWRMHKASLSNGKKDFGKYLSTYSRALTTGFKSLDKFLAEEKFFQQNLTAKFIVLKTFADHILHLYFNELYARIEPAELYETLAALDELLRRDFAAEENSALTAYLFNMLNVYRVEFLQLQRRVDELEKVAREDKAYIAELENFIAKLLNKE